VNLCVILSNTGTYIHKQAIACILIYRSTIRNQKTSKDENEEIIKYKHTSPS